MLGSCLLLFVFMCVALSGQGRLGLGPGTGLALLGLIGLSRSGRLGQHCFLS
jgi:hypothetical protein